MSSRPLRIFMSYRRANGGAPYAYIIAERLMSLGIEVFFDNKTLHDYNSNYKDKIFSEIDESDYVLLLLQRGCMTEKTNDVYLAEVRYSIDKLGMDRIIMLPLEESFSWESESTPADLEEKRISEHNHLSALRLEDLDPTIKNILARCTLNPEHRYYLMLWDQRMAAKRGGGNSILQRTGDIYNLPLEERWGFAKRVSVLSIGCGYLSGAMAPIIVKKFTEGVSFRFISVDPTGESATDVINTKLNSLIPELESEYLRTSQEKVRKLFEHITSACRDRQNEVEYRVTPYHLTCTIHIVEHDNSAYDYVFVEFIPISATGENQHENRAVVAYRDDATFDYYYRQFEKIWDSSRIIYKKESEAVLI